MWNLPSHEPVRVGEEDAVAGFGAKVDPFPLVEGAGIAGGVGEFGRRRPSPLRPPGAERRRRGADSFLLIVGDGLDDVNILLQVALADEPAHHV